MADRKNGAGSRLSGVLERSTPLDDDPVEPESAAQTADGGDGDPAAAARGKARAAAASPSRAAAEKVRKKIKGRTIYMPDDLFERVMVQAKRRSKHISDYVCMILERQVPDHRTVRGVGVDEHGAA